VKRIGLIAELASLRPALSILLSSAPVAARVAVRACVIPDYKSPVIPARRAARVSGNVSTVATVAIAHRRPPTPDAGNKPSTPEGQNELSLLRPQRPL
jgi:hypothetical protein